MSRAPNELLSLRSLSGSLPLRENRFAKVVIMSMDGKSVVGRLGIYLAIIGCLLAVSVSIANTYQFPKLAVLALGVLLIWISTDFDGASKPLLSGPVLMLVAVCLFTAIFSTDPIISLLGYYRPPFHGLLEVLLYASLYFAVSFSGAKRFVLPAIAFSAIPLTAYALIQVVGLDPLPWALPQGRATSFLGNPVYLGACYAIILPVTRHLLIKDSEREELDLWSILCLVSLIACGVGLALTKSRGAIFSAFVGVVVYDILSGYFPLILLRTR